MKARLAPLFAALASCAALACTPTGQSASSGSSPAASAPDVLPAPSARAAATPAQAKVTILYTSDEHGWILPATEKGKVLGGAAEILATWISKEGHCAGGDPCERPRTLLLSGGDNFTGPAVSSYWRGEPMAMAMKRMGYVASAFGNHEFDFGRDQFLANKRTSGATYLAANLRVKDGGPKELQTPAHIVVERNGARIAVVGLATESTTRTAMASRFEGIEFDEPEPALERAIPDAWGAGADAVVVIAHECHDVMTPLIARHPEWKLAFVGLGHCHRASKKEVHGVPVIAPGWRLRSYARVELTIDPSRPQRERVVQRRADVIDVEHAEASGPAPADATLSRETSAWRDKTEAALGEVIGYTKAGFEQKSHELGRWVARAWRDQFGTDVAIVNAGGLRQSVEPGPIKKSTVWSVLPFDNRIFVVRLGGADLVAVLANDEAIADGVRKERGSWVDARGKKIDPTKAYTVATIDFLYFGGAGFDILKKDPSPRDTGVDWREPVIAWTAKARSTEGAPIESKLR